MTKEQFFHQNKQVKRLYTATDTAYVYVKVTRLELVTRGWNEKEAALCEQIMSPRDFSKN